MDFVFLVPVAFFLTIAFLVKTGLDYSRWKKEHDRGEVSAGSSLGTGELRALIREAVEEANEPLLERVEALETHLEALAQPRLTTGQPALLDDLPEAYEDEALSGAQRHRVS